MRRSVEFMTMLKTLCFCYIGTLYTDHLVTLSDIIRLVHFKFNWLKEHYKLLVSIDILLSYNKPICYNVTFPNFYIFFETALVNLEFLYKKFINFLAHLSKRKCELLPSLGVRRRPSVRLRCPS